MMPLLIRGDARHLPLPDSSVDLIVTSPPYFGLREYRDHGGSMAAQLGAEPTGREFIAALIACTAEWARVLKPTGSICVNLGDKYAGSPSGPQGKSGARVDREQAQTYSAARGRQRGMSFDVPPKSLMLLPERYRIAAADDLGLIARAVLIWSKPNGLPESVTDRVRRSHEDWVHLTKSPRYFEAVDEIREPHSPNTHARRKDGALTARQQRWNADNPALHGQDGLGGAAKNPLGKLPGSVWEIATQPLNIPDHITHARCCDGQPRPGCEDGLDHYAAFPMEWPRRLILGWSPREVCTACGEGRGPVVDREQVDVPGGSTAAVNRATAGEARTRHIRKMARGAIETAITGYACACPDLSAPATPGVVLDPCSGTGTTALVAAMHGRIGIGVDLSHAYSADLARWRARDPKERARAAGLDPDAVAAIRRPRPEQFDLFGEEIG